MKPTLARLTGALCLALLTPLPAQQDELRPPKAIPVAEADPVAPAPPAAAPATPPKAAVIPEVDPPPVEPAPDEPWDGDTEAMNGKQRKQKEREAAEKAKLEKERADREMADKAEEVKTVKAVPNDVRMPPVIAPREVRPDKPKIPIMRQTDPDAKPLTLRVPAPRGLIVDRNGQPLAQTKMGHYIGVQLPLQEGLTDVRILDAAKGPLAFCQGEFTEKWDVSDEDIIQHYHKRRWVPLYCSMLLPEERAAKLKEAMPPGVVLRPIFLRTYPEQSLAGHLLGQMGKNPLGFSATAKQDLQAEELMWPPTVGKGGLEKRFDKELTGEPGLYNALFDAKGEKLSEEWTEQPRAGHTVVTTLDIGMQKIAERNLRERGVRGAFVIMDVRTGDILTMASTPAIDPNNWVHGVSDAFYKKVLADPEHPLMARAFMNRYPPASTFKIVTAFAALETDEIGPHSEFSCPPGMYFNKIYIKNHTKKHEGNMDVERAIMRSCNTWFFQAARVAGGAALSSMAIRFGYGDKTGICLDDMETAGFMPTPESYANAKPRGSLTGGVLAITSIGQGQVEATPLQVAQMMAGVARGDAVPRPRLVKMIQDVDGRIVQHFPPSTRAPLNLSQENLDAVRYGMRQVVTGGGGTGSRAENDYVAIAGKTGTGEWHPDKDQYVAWFAGFIPYKNPEYAYVCLYEGDPGESQISGGKKVAPIVGDVFNEIYKEKKKRGDIKEGAGDDDETLVTTRREKSKPAATEAPPAAPPPVAEAPRRGGLRWLFRRREKAPAAPPAPVPSGRPLR